MAGTNDAEPHTYCNKLQLKNQSSKQQQAKLELLPASSHRNVSILSPPLIKVAYKGPKLPALTPPSLSVVNTMFDKNK
jgi:hypothetical protein